MATYQSVSPDDKIDCVPHLERAQASLKAAEVLRDAGLTADAVTRAHQSTVHAERGLLATEKRSPQDPVSVHRMAVSHFLGNDLVATGQRDALERLLVLRRRADDQPLADISVEECADAVAAAAAFLSDVESHLTGEGYIR